MSPIEQKIASTLVKLALANGYEISVWEGGDYAIKQSREADAIIAALCSTDSDSLVLWDAGVRVGSIVLIWGNGEDLISDHTDRADITNLVEIANKEAGVG
jgi:hypothetical protein